jgi:hypothetical protein
MLFVLQEKNKMDSRTRILFSKLKRHALRMFYSFDRWHVSPIEERPYAKDIIAFCNLFSQKESFVEIGCGLGDIIRNVNFQKRIGFDIDEKVLKAARFLARNEKGIFFHKFSFPESPLTEQMNVLVIVNWIHHIEPSLLKRKMHAYFNQNLTNEGILIMDTVQDKAYKFNHDINFLSEGLNCELELLGSYERSRKVWIVKRLN